MFEFLVLAVFTHEHTVLFINQFTNNRSFDALVFEHLNDIAGFVFTARYDQCTFTD